MLWNASIPIIFIRFCMALNSYQNCKMKTRHLRIQDAGFCIGKKEEVISNNYKPL